MSDVDPTMELWNTPDRSQYFLLPKDVPMPAGELLIKAGPLKSQQVDAELAAQYACTREEARAYINQRMVGAFGRLQEVARAATREAGRAIQEPGTPVDPEAIFGVDPGAMVTDKQAAKEGLKTVAATVNQAIGAALPTEADRQAYQEKVETMAEALTDPEGPLMNQLKGFSDGLEGAIPTLAEKLAELGEALQKSADQLRESQNNREN